MGFSHAFTVSKAALAAEVALEAPRASITALPRCCTAVQQRGKAVIDARGASSATSAAKAALDTVKACENPTASGDVFSAAVYSDGSYDIPEGIMCGLPLMTTSSGDVEIVRDFTLSDFAKAKIQISVDELLAEREAVQDLLND